MRRKRYKTAIDLADDLNSEACQQAINCLTSLRPLVSILQHHNVNNFHDDSKSINNDTDVSKEHVSDDTDDVMTSYRDVLASVDSIWQVFVTTVT